MHRLRRLLLLGICFAALAPLSNSYKTGAPKEACQDMIPQHDTPPQKIRSPYIIKISKPKISRGGSTDITITGKGGEKFKGFLLQARVGSTPVGQFRTKTNAADVRFIDCGSGKQNAATHTSNNEKKEVTVTWTAPPNLQESVIFYATVAKNGGEFWVAQKSPALTVE